MVDVSTLYSDFKSEAGARLLYYLSSAVVIVFLSRQLQPSEYGTLFLAISVLTVGRLFSSMGLAKSAAKHVSYYLDSDPRQIRHVVLSSLKYSAVTISIVTVTIVLTAGTIADALGNPSLEPMFIVGGFYIIFATLYNYTRVILQGFQDIYNSALVYASEGIGRIIGVLVLVSLGYGIYGALIGYILGFVLAALYGLKLLYERLPSKDETDTIEDGLKNRVLRYSFPLAITRGAWVLDREVDLIIVGFLINPAVVGYYAISKQIVTFTTGMAGSVGFSLGPKFNESTVSQSKERARNTYEKVLVYILLVYLPAVAGLAILAEPIVTSLFGQEYRNVVPILQVFCAAIVLISVTETTEDILDYLGRANSRAKFKIVTSVGNVFLSIGLIITVGAIGAALATVFMQAIYALLCLYVVRSEIGLRTGYLLRQVGHVLGITAVMSIVVLYLSQYVAGVITIAAIILCGTAIWGILSVRGGFLSMQSVYSLGLLPKNRD